MPLPRIALTPGEPAGIGPDLIVTLAQTARAAELVVIADPELLQSRARLLGLPLQLHSFNPLIRRPHQAGELTILPVPLTAPVSPGQLDVANGPYVLETLRIAGAGCLDQQFDAVITAPVQKSVINNAGVAFSGHTEFFQAQAGVPRVVMMLACPGLRVALATTHLPLRDVADAITVTRLHEVLAILVADLRSKFGIARSAHSGGRTQPAHAGEGGHLGREEIDTHHSRAWQRLRADRNCELDGPAAGGHVVHPGAHLAHGGLPRWRCITTKGLPVLKHAGFGGRP
jgi:4-hydroxythreonine-4-phosphate dehydrogenase